MVADDDDERIASSAPEVLRTRCGLIAIGWKLAAASLDDVRVFESSDELMREETE